MTVRDLLDRIDGPELAAWMAYEQVTGTLGPERDDMLMAMLATVVASPWVGKGKKLKPTDFMPDWDQKPQTADQMLNTVRLLNQMLGGKEN